MKKFFAFAVVAVATLASCGGNNENANADSVAMDSAAVVAPVVEQVQAVADSGVAVVDSAAANTAAAATSAAEAVKDAVAK
jgi:lipoprotein